MLRIYFLRYITHKCSFVNLPTQRGKFEKRRKYITTTSNVEIIFFCTTTSRIVKGFLFLLLQLQIHTSEGAFFVSNYNVSNATKKSFHVFFVCWYDDMREWKKENSSIFLLIVLLRELLSIRKKFCCSLLFISLLLFLYCSNVLFLCCTSWRITHRQLAWMQSSPLTGKSSLKWRMCVRVLWNEKLACGNVMGNEFHWGI